jgi:hypothetical protein
LWNKCNIRGRPYVKESDQYEKMRAMKKTGLIMSVILAVLFLWTSGCQDMENDQTGRIVVKITDAPFPINLIDEANVTITRVEIRNTSDTIGYPFLSIFEDTVEFNLLELRNGVTAELLDTEIPSGEYDLIRIYVEEASIAVKDHDVYSVKVPSGSSTGIKVFIKPSLRIAGGLTEVLLDFNLDRSFVLKGNMDSPAGIKGFNFKPVIRAVNSATTGTVEGIVMDVDSVLIQDAVVWIAKDTIVTTSYTDGEGYYAMTGIPAGIYSLSAVKEGFDTLTFEGVDIIEGNLTTQDFILEVPEK